MNTNFLAKSAALATAATMRVRAESGGASPAKDDAANGANGANGNGHAVAENDAGKKKKKKNKKRNSRSSLTAEDGVNGADAEDEDLEESLSSAPSPVVTTVLDSAPAPTAVEVAETSPFDWTKPAKQEAPLLDLPSPAPVSSGSPFDVFDTPDTVNTSSSTAASTVVMPPTTPVADAASAALPAVDLADLFGSASPVQVPANRAPPPPPPTPVVVAEPAPVIAAPSPPRVVEFAPASVVEAIASPPQPTRAEPEASNSAMSVQSREEIIHLDPVSPVPMAPVTDSESAAVQAPDSESPVPKDVGTGPLMTLSAPSDTLTDVAEARPVPEVHTAASLSPTSEHTLIEPAVIPSTPPVVYSDIASEIEIATVTHTPTKTEESAVNGELPDHVALSGEAVDEVDNQAQADTTFEAELAALAASPSTSPASPSTSVQETQLQVELPPTTHVASAPPAPVGAKTKSSKTPSATGRSAKSPTNGTVAPEPKTVGAKPSVATAKQPSGARNTPVTATKAVSKTSSVRTPTKQAPKPSVVSPSTTSGATKTAGAKAPPLQRSLSGSTVVRKPAKSPTSGNSSPTQAHPTSSDSEPKVAKKKLSASEIDAAGNRLYEQAMESKRRLEAKKALREEEFTFTPQVNPKSKKLDNADAPNRFVMLHERAKEAQRKKEELREKLEKEECTFKPQITNKAKKIASTSDKPRFENLYRNALEIQAKREEKKKQEQEKNEEELTFKPKIKATKSPVRSRPLYDPEAVKQKRLELEQKKMESEQQAKPKVVRKVRTDDSDNKIFDRLYQGGQQRAERLAKLKQEREEQEKASTTFQPKVSSAAASTKTSSQPFHQRLYDKDYLKKVAAEREQRKIEEEKKRFSFKPRVSDMPDSVRSKGSSEGGSTGKSTIFERLYQDKDRVKEKIELSEELKIQKEMEECTFRPQIDPPASATSKGEATTPIWERLLSIDKNQIADERERQKAQLELEACTFRPEISPTPGSLSPKRASSNNIFERLSSSAGNTPVDEKKRRPSERKSIAAEGKRNSYNERGAMKEQYAQRRALSVGDILKSSNLGTPHDNVAGDVIEEEASAPRSAPGSSSSQAKSFNGSSGVASSDPAQNVARSLDMELNEPDVLAAKSQSILENYDTWAASLEEKMRNLG